MAKNEGGAPIDGGAPEPTQENRERDQTGITGNAAVKGGHPSRGDRDGGEDSSAGDCAAIDLDSAHDRAS